MRLLVVLAICVGAFGGCKKSSGSTCTSSNKSVHCANLTCSGGTPICCANDDNAGPGPGACVADVHDQACQSSPHECDDGNDCPSGTVCCVYGLPTGGGRSKCEDHCTLGTPAPAPESATYGRQACSQDCECIDGSNRCVSLACCLPTGAPCAASSGEDTGDCCSGTCQIDAQLSEGHCQ